METKMEITHKEWQILNRQTDEILAEWWCLLNNWEWVNELGEEEKPENYKNGRRTSLMKSIERLISEKYLARYWNKKMQNFEEWWEKTHSPDIKVRDKYMRERIYGGDQK